jgi:hypothetical protein
VPLTKRPGVHNFVSKLPTVEQLTRLEMAGELCWPYQKSLRLATGLAPEDFEGIGGKFCWAAWWQGITTAEIRLREQLWEASGQGNVSASRTLAKCMIAAVEETRPPPAHAATVAKLKESVRLAMEPITRSVDTALSAQRAFHRPGK